jgi:aminocarboxymuconate-semialdehyde decarboxylase
MLVDTHIHYLPDVLRAAYRCRSEPPMVVEGVGGDSLVYGGGHVEPIGPAAGQRDRLFAAFGEAGTDLALVSGNQPGVLGLPAEDAPAVAREANDELLELAACSRGRVVGLATLPWQDPAAAVEELERVTGLGMRGAMVCSNICGEPIDGPRFRPVLEAASRLGAPLLLHPTLPLSAPHLHEYKGLLAAVGYMFDTTTAATRLLVSGVPQELPDLGIVLAHSASLLPALAGRLDEEWRRGGLALPDGADGPPSELLRWLYSDTAGGSVAAVHACISILGADRVMFGSDYPFWTAGHAAKVFTALSLSEADRALVAGDTALALFGLGRGEGGPGT